MRLGLFLDEWRDGGVPVFFDRLERFLTAEGHEVFVYLLHPHPKKGEMPRELYRTLKARLGERCVPIHLNSYPKSWRAAHLSETLLAHGISCLLMSHFITLIEMFEGVGASLPLVPIAHSDFDYYYVEFLRTMGFAAAQIAVSQRIHQKCRLLSSPEFAGKVHYIPYGVEDSPYFQPHRAGPLRIVYCSRLEPMQKRCQDLFPIWQDYRQRGGGGQLVVLGGGEAEPQLRAAFRDEMAAGRVSVRGHVSCDEVLREMAGADVLLNISNIEGLPQVALEGAMLGLYPLLSDIESGHREIVANLGQGTLCHVGDVAAFGHELFQLEQRLPELREGRVNRRKVAQNLYSFETCGRRYLEVLETVARPVTAQIAATTYRPSWRERISRRWLLRKYRRYYAVP